MSGIVAVVTIEESDRAFIVRHEPLGLVAVDVSKSEALRKLAKMMERMAAYAATEPKP